jgi:predicted O-methyltransferase YrrM
MEEIKQTSFSTADLAQMLKTDVEKVTTFLNHSGFVETVEVNGEKFTAEENLQKFFRSYVSFYDIALKSYEIPEDLANSGSPWATTIVDMYNQSFAFPASVSPSQGQLLKSIVCNLNPQIVLEIGCFIGISTLWMASGLEQIRSGGFVHSVDLFNTIMPWPPHSYGYLKNPVDFAQKCAVSAQLSHRIEFHKMDSNTLGRKINEIVNKPIDFLYIDGDHSIHGCVTDFALFSPHVPVGGYIMLHDIYPKYCGHDGPRYLIDNFVKNSPHFSLVEIDTSPHNFGMALIQKLSEDQNLQRGGNLKMKLQKTRAKMAKTDLWNNLRGTRLGKSIKKIIR